MKHTAGPWGVEKGMFIVVDSDRCQLAAISYYGDADESQANTTLIAAAPKLLEHCQSMYSILSVLASKQKAGWNVDLITDLYELLSKVDPTMKMFETEIVKG